MNNKKENNKKNRSKIDSIIISLLVGINLAFFHELLILRDENYILQEVYNTCIELKPLK